MAISSA
nr:TPA_asm: M33 uORF [Murid betaherpesvirus 1]DBA07763.1 TPA_asm: M33 uORF [Murid betaherpesvirus 1]